MKPLFLSRVSLRSDASIRAMAPLLVPENDDARIMAAHRLIWSLFAGDEQRKRDFLWREEGPGRYLVQSIAALPSRTELFDIESKPFAMLPAAGERFAFALRCNPTVSVLAGQPPRLRRNGKRASGKIVDVVMHSLHPTPGRRNMGDAPSPGEGRAFVREDLLGWLDPESSRDPRRPIEEWLARKGERSGFRLEQARIGAYRPVRLPRGGRQEPATFGQADAEGVLTVTDTLAFEQALRAGLGRAKAFGCGLLLIKRT
jgi:CRISPR system Cascade subunit CasE